MRIVGSQSDFLSSYEVRNFYEIAVSFSVWFAVYCITIIANPTFLNNVRGSLATAIQIITNHQADSNYINISSVILVAVLLILLTPIISALYAGLLGFGTMASMRFVRYLIGLFMKMGRNRFTRILNINLRKRHKVYMHMRLIGVFIFICSALLWIVLTLEITNQSHIQISTPSPDGHVPLLYKLLEPIPALLVSGPIWISLHVFLWERTIYRWILIIVIFFCIIICFYLAHQVY